MYAKTMGIYSFLVAGIRLSRYLIRENRRLSKPLITFTQVRILNLFKKLTLNYCSLDWIYCVRWSPSGDKLASASNDKTAKLLDIKTGKVLYTGNTSNGSKLSISKCIIVIHLSESAMSVCFI